MNGRLRVLLVVGIAGSGKTTVVSRLIGRLGAPSDTLINRRALDGRVVNPVTVTVYPETRSMVMGVYDGTSGAGTDKFGLSACPAAVGLIADLAHDDSYAGYILFVEGDRVTNRSFVDAVDSLVNLVIVHLVVSDAELARRREERGPIDRNPKGGIARRAKKQAAKREAAGLAPRDPNQAPNWLAGRQTKLQHVMAGRLVIHLRHETPEDTDRVVHILNVYREGRIAVEEEPDRPPVG